ncbi:replication-associated recombination protein A [Hydrogenibacillus schlegelii]|uniref:AAA family ATPase n=1 Tax=Hydrogenibacillus schlegelii TaxID=1484 RepID=A0A179ITH5_HYDSH|nr:replication-associated recombination protein A [Hydrogenibacillus schlegelii]MBT9282390.1 replication-associated recombination protein A [Hydrogenibacillus schlegelii]OAR05625.1 AAA family ATPase [Hydrogenibacillus schlegelii]
MDLFDFAREKRRTAYEPLASAMRPETLDEIVGQDHILGPGKLLRRAIETDRLSSVIFYGPPGTGKTTIARVIARTTRAHFEALNAVTAGVADLRRIVEEARTRLGMEGRRTVLFIDEIHRFNKAQQDALLPHVEDGTIVLIGATTENPFFEVNSALLSRSLIFPLHPLSPADLRTIAERALRSEKGLGALRIEVEEKALEHLIAQSDGDARRLLNALELAATSTPPDEDGVIRITLAVAEESIQRRAVRYDKTGDNHYDTISAYIKSIRGSDPDAALYWLARMLDAGEDPRFIARRLVIAAAEDVGNAAPEGLSLAMAAYLAVERIGLPEGRIPLAQATVYLALAPKSNASYKAIDAYLEEVRKNGHRPVPPPLRDAHYRGAERLGHGVGYLYPHDFPGHFVRQAYLPEGVPRLFVPTEEGREVELAARYRRLWGEGAAPGAAGTT